MEKRLKDIRRMSSKEEGDWRSVVALALEESNLTSNHYRLLVTLAAVAQQIKRTQASKKASKAASAHTNRGDFGGKKPKSLSRPSLLLASIADFSPHTSADETSININMLEGAALHIRRNGGRRRLCDPL